MFKVQRYTAEDNDDVDRGGSGSSNAPDGKDLPQQGDLINSLVQRAKARLNRERTEGEFYAGTSGHDSRRDPNAASRVPKAAGGGDTGASLSPMRTSSDDGDFTAVSSTTRRERSSRKQNATHDANGGAGPDVKLPGGHKKEDEEKGGSSSSSSSSGSDDDASSGDSAAESSSDRGSPEDPGAIGTTKSTAQPSGSPLHEAEEDGQEGVRPMQEVADEWGLDARLTETLREEGVKHFFPIQVPLINTQSR